jgi:hypothetical protein
MLDTPEGLPVVDCAPLALAIGCKALPHFVFVFLFMIWVWERHTRLEVGKWEMKYPAREARHPLFVSFHPTPPRTPLRRILFLKGLQVSPNGPNLHGDTVTLT